MIFWLCEYLSLNCVALALFCLGEVCWILLHGLNGQSLLCMPRCRLWCTYYMKLQNHKEKGFRMMMDMVMIVIFCVLQICGLVDIRLSGNKVLVVPLFLDAACSS